MNFHNYKPNHVSFRLFKSKIYGYFNLFHEFLSNTPPEKSTHLHNYVLVPTTQSYHHNSVLPPLEKVSSYNLSLKQMNQFKFFRLKLVLVHSH